MVYKKPLPLLLVHATPPRLCAICGAPSYSREGIHPQCAERRADAPRMERIKADRNAAERSTKASNSPDFSYWHKRCPRCQAQLHIRKLMCSCGYRFDVKM